MPPTPSRASSARALCAALTVIMLAVCAQSSSAAQNAPIVSFPLLTCEGEQVIAWLGLAGPDTMVAAIADGRRLTIHEVEGETVAPMTSVDATEMGPVRGIAIHPDGYWVSAAQGLWLTVLGDCALRYDVVNAHMWYPCGSFTDETSWRGGISGGGALMGLGDGTAYAVLTLPAEERPAAFAPVWGWGRTPGILGLIRLQGGSYASMRSPRPG